MQTSQSAPGQLAAAIAKAHPREVVTVVSAGTASGLTPAALLAPGVNEIPPSPGTEETLAKLMGREPGGTETAAGDS